MIHLGSKLTQKLLKHLFKHHSQAFYVNELTRLLNLDKRNLVRKLKELESEGLLKSTRKQNLRLYQINTKYSLYREYEKIVSDGLRKG